MAPHGCPSERPRLGTLKNSQKMTVTFFACEKLPQEANKSYTTQFEKIQTLTFFEFLPKIAFGRPPRSQNFAESMDLSSFCAFPSLFESPPLLRRSQPKLRRINEFPFGFSIKNSNFFYLEIFSSASFLWVSLCLFPLRM